MSLFWCQGSPANMGGIARSSGNCHDPFAVSSCLYALAIEMCDMKRALRRNLAPRLSMQS